MRAARVDLSNATWRKSTYSNGQGGDCLEIAEGLDVVPVRDSKQHSERALLVSRASWTAFIGEIKRSLPPASGW